jgi:NAD(P)-dependent dehydrogenase (short-subunit alcohol dehydrogenase family)
VVDTAGWDRFPTGVKEDLFRQQVEMLPVRRVGQPQDIAHAYLLSAGEHFMTGAAIECDGGLRLL